MTQLAFVVPGNPVPWSLTVARGAFARLDPKAKAYKLLVQSHALRAVQQAKRVGVAWPTDAVYDVQIAIRRRTRQRFDVDRLLNCVLDAMTGVVYVDDRAAFVRTVIAIVGEPDAKGPRVSVLVRAVPAALIDADATALERDVKNLCAARAWPVGPAGRRVA